MKVTLTQQEICEKLGFPEGTEIVIVEEDNEAKLHDDGWISNIGNDKREHPDSLSGNTLIEVKLRSGYTYAGHAGDWEYSWKETNGYPLGIVAYRIMI